MTIKVRVAHIDRNGIHLKSGFSDVKVVLEVSPVENPHTNTTLVIFKDSESEEQLITVALVHPKDYMITDQNWLSFLEYKVNPKDVRTDPTGKQQVVDVSWSYEFKKLHFRTVSFTWQGRFGKKRYLSFGPKEDKRLLIIESDQFDGNYSLTVPTGETIHADGGLIGKLKVLLYPDRLDFVPYQKIDWSSDPLGNSTGPVEPYTLAFRSELSEKTCAELMLNKVRLGGLDIWGQLIANRKEVNDDSLRIMKPKFLGLFRFLESSDGNLRVTTDPSALGALLRNAAIMMEHLPEPSRSAYKLSYDEALLMLSVGVPSTVIMNYLMRLIQEFYRVSDKISFDLTPEEVEKVKGLVRDKKFTVSFADVTSDPYRFGEDELRSMSMDVDSSEVKRF